MNAFCTLFDSLYLIRGIALYRSIEQQSKDFHLFIYCLDDKTYEILKLLSFKHATPIKLTEFETKELLKVKPTRNKAEYCWTCTPHITADALHRFNLREVTYLDADLFFFQNPSILLKEFNENDSSVLLTEHHYTPQFDQSKKSGKYCVQFMAFRSNENGHKILRWWGDRCLEWCFDRVENGKLGDQKYLDDWLERFKGVKVLQHKGGGVAPWNIQQYQVTDGPCINGIPIVFYHFHGLKYYETEKADLSDGHYHLSKSAIEKIYLPYLQALKNSKIFVQNILPEFREVQLPCPPKGVRPFLCKIKRQMKGTYYVVQI